MRVFVFLLIAVGWLPAWSSFADNACPHPGFLPTSASIELAHRLSAQLLALRNQPLIERYLYPYQQTSDFAESLHEASIIVRGVPPNIQLLSPTGRTFRIYVDSESLSNILATQHLISAYLPYVVLAKHVSRKFFDDLTGVFLTLPERQPRDVGLESKTKTLSFIDFTLPDTVPVLEIEPNNIFLIPLNPNYRDWVRKQYAAWKAGQEVSPMDHLWLQAIDARNLIHQPVGVIPIHILQHGVYTPQ